IAWNMRGTNYPNQISFLPSAPVTATGEGVGDLDKNGSDDLIYQDGTAVYAQLLNRSTLMSTVLLGTTSDTNWQLQGVGDMDNDDNLDLVFRYQGPGSNAGRTAVWFMNGTQVRSSQYLGLTEPDLNWRIVGVADMDGDRLPDIAMRNYSNGENKV